MKNMHKQLAIAIVATAIQVWSPASQADIVYSLVQTNGPVSVVGTITTDGTIGYLDRSNITDWSFTINDSAILGTTPEVLTYNPATCAQERSCSLLYLLSPDLYASPGVIYFSTLNPDGDSIWFLPQFSANSFYLEYNGIAGFILQDGLHPLDYDISNFPAPNEFLYPPYAGSIIATSVPEPTAFALMGIGLTLVGVAAKRRRK
ncbi:MAG TPA: PEP-CTERM sorting domain-containing protein, partial [Burkholderiales bacterium]|nr:PEP-CTERM sorting domain-containing protein [Burkholderiales bacterium]